MTVHNTNFAIWLASNPSVGGVQKSVASFACTPSCCITAKEISSPQVVAHRACDRLVAFLAVMSQQARDLFQRAEPLLRQKRKGGWSSADTWQTLIEHWLLDAGEVINISVPKNRKARRMQVCRWRDKLPEVVDLMQGMAPAERPEFISMLRKLATASGRRELLDDVAAEDTAVDQQQRSRTQQVAAAARMDAAHDSMSQSVPSNDAPGSVEWSRSTSCRRDWIELVRCIRLCPA